MKNLTIYLPLVDGLLVEHPCYSGRELIESVVGDELIPPPTSLVFEAFTKDGKRVRISIPYSDPTAAANADVADIQICTCRHGEDVHERFTPTFCQLADCECQEFKATP